MHDADGRPSIPPAHPRIVSPPVALYSVRGKRQFCARLPYDLLFVRGRH
jgi:hypothetical protein